jgi:hypothetical protein
MIRLAMIAGIVVGLTGQAQTQQSLSVVRASLGGDAALSGARAEHQTASCDAVHAAAARGAMARRAGGRRRRSR